MPFKLYRTSNYRNLAKYLAKESETFFRCKFSPRVFSAVSEFYDRLELTLTNSPRDSVARTDSLYERNSKFEPEVHRVVGYLRWNATNFIRPRQRKGNELGRGAMLARVAEVCKQTMATVDRTCLRNTRKVRRVRRVISWPIRIKRKKNKTDKPFPSNALSTCPL